MVQTIYSDVESGFCWIDICNPEGSELDDVKKKYHVHSLLINDILDPHHLPKFEKTEAVFFCILRAVDENVPPGAYTVQAITRKVAFLWNEQFLITVRRKSQPFFEEFIKNFQNKVPKPGNNHLVTILSSLFLAVIETYHPVLESADTFIEETETHIFHGKQTPEVVGDLYTFRSRVNAIRRTLRMTLEALQEINQEFPKYSTVYKNLSEVTEHALIRSEELKEDSIQLVNMYLSISSHQSNEITKVLTLFSAFFLPITFIVGVYGMNFEFMPELRHPWGYGVVWLVMALVSLFIFVWFKRNKWI